MFYFLTFDQIAQDTPVGGKAYNLSELYKAGFNVPEGAVITADALSRFMSLYEDKLKPAIQSLYYSNDELFIKKASALIHKLFLDQKVPSEVFVSANSFMEELLQKGYSAVAVRSSCSMEDTEDNSFAGQYESVLNVKTAEDLEAAILTCWASAYNERVYNYCKKNNLSHADIRLNVLIQGMINSESSGVLFTVNPLTGNDKQMVIEAVKGLGEALVQGVVTPDTYNYDWYNEKLEIVTSLKQDKYLVGAKGEPLTEWINIENPSQILSEKQIKNLAEIALKIQQHYGSSQDIEWAFFNNEFFVLQSRPLTSIKFETEGEWTTADLKDGGISSTNTTPLMYSLYEYAFENSMPQFLESIHVSPKVKPLKYFNWFMGYSYWNMKAVKEGAKKIPGFVERKFDEDLGIDPDYSGDGHKTAFTPVSLFNGIRILTATNKSIKKRLQICKTVISRIKEIISEFEKINFSEITDAALLKRMQKLVKEDYLLNESGYFLTIYDNSNATTLFHETLDKYNKKQSEKINYLKLITGLQNLSHMRPTFDLWEISRVIKTDSLAFEFYTTTKIDKISELYFQKVAFSFSKEISEYIDKFKYHSLRELDITVPHWIEDPTQVFEALRDLLSQPDESSPKAHNNEQNRIYVQERKRIKLKSLQKKLDVHRHLLWWREEMRDYSTKIYFWIRMFTLETGKRLAAKNLLNEANDVFYLKFPELFDLCKGEKVDYYRDLIKKNKVFYSSFRNYNKPNEIFGKRFYQKKKSDRNAKIFKGIACSSGMVEGIISVIPTIFEVDKLVPGTILVTKFTDPSWTPAFSKISGLITETGGMLSHGAVVSREYGIPAVLAINDITSILKTGMKIRIDGDTGEVTILN